MSSAHLRNLSEKLDAKADPPGVVPASVRLPRARQTVAREKRTLMPAPFTRRTVDDDEQRGPRAAIAPPTTAGSMRLSAPESSFESCTGGAQ